jgi:hypothetical protein
MRKFIVYTRAIPGCCKVGDAPTVVEVEGEVVSAQEDITVQWLPAGEFKFRITKPDFLLEKDSETIYYSHSVYWTIHGAYAAADRIIRQSLEFTQRKTKGEPFTEEELKAKIAEITEILL